MLLEINNLEIKYGQSYAVKGFNLSLNQGETVGIIGESGCGKTSILMSIMGVLPKSANISGNIKYNGLELTSISQKQYNGIRWDEISIVFQNSMRYLNPILTVYDQISEVMKKDANLTKKEKISKLEELFARFDLDNKWMFSLPRSLSGGMLQKVLIIMALASQPKLLLIDEPTTALENISRIKLIQYLDELKQQKNITMIVVSHDLKVIQALANKSIVMYKGNVFEKGITKQILDEPKHPYSNDLISASHDINPYRDLWGIQPIDQVSHKGCAYYNYCTQRIDLCRKEVPPIIVDEGVSCHRNRIVDLFVAKNINKTFYLNNQPVEACVDCSLKLKHGEILSIIGHSGSGKTTLAQILAGILEYDSGTLDFNEEEFSGDSRMNILNGVQIVFQDPYSSINPNFTVKQAIMEPLNINSIYDIQLRERLMDESLQSVELKDVIDYNSKVKNLSGGQIQRVATARALIMEPKLLIADEITASLDISNKVNLLRLLKGLQNRKGFAMIFITHDLRMAQKISDKIAVMKDGKIVEQNPSHKVFSLPKHPYTKKLVAMI